MNKHYDITAHQLSVINEVAKNSLFDALSLTFTYGYVKGYRSAMAEMKYKTNKKG